MSKNCPSTLVRERSRSACKRAQDLRIASRQLRQSLDRLRAHTAELTRAREEGNISPAADGEWSAAAPATALDLGALLLARVRTAREQARSLRLQAAALKKQAAEFRKASEKARGAAGHVP